MTSGQTTIAQRVAGACTTVAAVLAIAACGDEAASGSPDFTAGELAGLNLAPDAIPGMDYQADASGAGAFAAQQREQAKEEGDEGGLELVRRLEELGLEADHVSQFFATSRHAEPVFAESVAFLFEDEEAAEEAVEIVRVANAASLDSARSIEAPDLGEETFGARGDFDGFLVYSYGWRVGDVIQVATVAPGDNDAGPESTLELADDLEAKARQ